MTTQYPNGIDGDVQIPLTTDNVTPVKAEVINTLRGAIIAVEQELGLNPAREYATVRARLDAMQNILSALQSVGGGTGNANLTTTKPVNVTKSPSQLGSIQEAALSDHKHDISTSSATSIGSVNSEGSSTFLARADHTHAVVDININSQVKGSILYYNGSNWVQLSPGTEGYILTTHGPGSNPNWQVSPTGTTLTTIAPVNVTRAAAVVGTANDAARSDHKHDISTAVPIPIGNANAEGTSTNLARADHLHALSGNVGGNLSGTLPNPSVVDFTIAGASQGSVLYYNGAHWVQLSPGIDGYVLTTHSTGNNPAWTSLPSGIALAVVAPLDVDKTVANVGTSARAAHEDHKHDINTASAISIGAVNSEGTATTLARSDHTHAVSGFSITGQTQGDIIYYNGTSWVRLAGGTDGNVLTTHGSAANPTWSTSSSSISLTNTPPVNVDASNAVVGVATTAARSDHKHNIATATAISIGTVNSQGTAITLARSDHTHAVTGLNIANQAQGDIIYYDGTSWVRLAAGTTGFVLQTNSTSGAPTWVATTNLTSAAPVNVNVNAAAVGVAITAARSDHKHNIDVATAVSIGATNSAGTSTSLARADHTHAVVDLNITGETQGDIIYYNGTSWVRLAGGTDGNVLTTHGVTASPSWSVPSGGSPVISVFGRVGAVTSQIGDYTSTQITNSSSVIGGGASVTTALNALQTEISSLSTGVISVFGRSGHVTGQYNDYNSSLIFDASTIGATTVTNALNILNARASGISSVFGRTGPAITAGAGDYYSTQIENFSGVPGVNVTDALNNLNGSLSSINSTTTFIQGQVNILNTHAFLGDIMTPIVKHYDGSTAWSFIQGGNVCWAGNGTGSEFFGPIGPLPVGVQIYKVSIYIQPNNGHTNLPLNMPRLRVWRIGPTPPFGIITTSLIGQTTDTSSPASNYNLPHYITCTIDGAYYTTNQSSFTFTLTDEYGTNSLPLMQLVSLVVSLS